MTKKSEKNKEVTFMDIDGSDAVDFLSKEMGMTDEATPEPEPTPELPTDEATPEPEPTPELPTDLQQYYREVCGLYSATFKDFAKNLKTSHAQAFCDNYANEINTVFAILNTEWTGFDDSVDADVKVVALIKTKELLIRVQQGLRDKKEALLTYLQNNAVFKNNVNLIAKIKQTNASEFYAFL